MRKNPNKEADTSQSFSLTKVVVLSDSCRDATGKVGASGRSRKIDAGKLKSSGRSSRVVRTEGSEPMDSPVAAMGAGVRAGLESLSQQGNTSFCTVVMNDLFYYIGGCMNASKGLMQDVCASVSAAERICMKTKQANYSRKRQLAHRHEKPES